MTHTPGPWSLDSNGDVVAGPHDIALVWFHPDDSHKANAALIAAAPDLLKSVIELLKPLERASAAMVAQGRALDEHGEAAFDRARAAILRATPTDQVKDGKGGVA